MVVKGLDNGYLFTKDNEGRIFKSAYSLTDPSITDQNKIAIDGNVSYFGSGNTNSDEDKINKDITKVCILSNIALTGDYEYALIVGLPMIQFKRNKDEFRDIVMSYNNCTINYENTEFKPRIKTVDVYAQGLGAVYKMGLKDGMYISFDLGSYTINAALVEIINGVPTILHYDTWYNGILTLYNDIIKGINVNTKATLDVSYAEKILFNNELSVNGENIDVRFIRATLRGYLENILSKFKPNYPYSTETIIFSGGGSVIFSDIFLELFPNSLILPDSQFANAIGYYNYGCDQYNKYLIRG